MFAKVKAFFVAQVAAAKANKTVAITCAVVGAVVGHIL